MATERYARETNFDVHAFRNSSVKISVPPANNGGRLIFGMAYQVSCYLQSLRRQWALSQEELGQLLGNLGQKYVSALETERIEPNIFVLFALEIIFGHHSKDVFTALFDKAEEDVVRALYIFQEELAGDASPEAERKRQLVSEALSRAVLFAKPTLGYEL